MLADLLRRPFVVRGAVGVFCLYVFVLAAAALSVGAGEVEFATVVWAEPEWAAGRPAGMRVAVQDPSVHRFLPGFEAEVTLVPDSGHAAGRAAGRAVTLGRIATPMSAHSLTVTVPADFPEGPATLVVEARRGEASDVARAAVRVAAARGPGDAPTQVPPASRDAPAPDGKTPPPNGEPPAVSVQVRPACAVLVSDLRQRILLRAVDRRGRPVETTVALAVKGGALEGLPPTLRTDAWGLADAWVRPTYHELKLVATPDGQPPQELELHGKPAQFVASASVPVSAPAESGAESAASASDSASASAESRAGWAASAPDRPLVLSVESLHGTGEVHGDVWRRGRWVGAASAWLEGGRARLALPAPGAPDGAARDGAAGDGAAGDGAAGNVAAGGGAGDVAPVVVQVYRAFAAPGDARAVLALLPTADPIAAARRLLPPAARWPDAPRPDAQGPPPDAPPPPADAQPPPPPADAASAERVIAWALAAWPARPPEPPLRVDTGPALEASARHRQDRIRGRLTFALSATGVLLVLGLAYIFVFHVLRLERRYQALGPDEDHPAIGRTRAGWEALLLLATIALAITGLILMLDGLRWGVDLRP